MKLANQLEQQRAQIMMSGDTAKLAALLSDDLYYGHSGGYWDNKEGYVKKFGDGSYAYQLVEIKVERAVAAGDTSLVIHGEVTLKVQLHGEDKTMTSIYLAVWRMEQGAWRFLSHQTALKQSL